MFLYWKNPQVMGFLSVPCIEMALALPKSCRHGKWVFVAYGKDKKLCGRQVSSSTLEYRVHTRVSIEYR